MVRAAQKGEMENPSPEVAKVAATTKRSDVKKFASTKHKGLPEKKKMKESFTIDKKAHRTAQKFAKIRNLAKKGATEGERAAAEKKSKGPKMFGEGSAYGITRGDGKPKGQMAAFAKKKKENPYSLKNKLNLGLSKALSLNNHFSQPFIETSRFIHAK